MQVKKQHGHGTIYWFQIWKGVHQGRILSLCLFNLCAELLLLSHFSRVRLCVTPAFCLSSYFIVAFFDYCQVASVMSDSVRPHRWQPTRLPEDSPGKNTGVGCHFLLQCLKVKSESEVGSKNRCGGWLQP